MFNSLLRDPRAACVTEIVRLLLNLVLRGASPSYRRGADLPVLFEVSRKVRQKRYKHYKSLLILLLVPCPPLPIRHFLLIRPPRWSTRG